MIYVFPAIFGFVLTLVFVLFALKFFPKIGLMDRPHLYGLKREAIPYYGGLIIYTAFLISVLVFVPMNTHVLGLLLAASMVMFIGFLDDMWRISPLIRLIVQFVAGVVLFLFGIGILSVKVPFLGVLDFTGFIFEGFFVLSGLLLFFG